ncbi:MAG: hypothetical protein M1835_005528 [Candelina submexicana]|nr:MAG: hypothetical protein M1835_005528 [Candelina submexicana]
MVLEDASATSDFVSDSSPTSDNDPYSSSNGDAPSTHSTAVVNIDISNFPKPLPIVGPLFGYTTSFTRMVIQGRLIGSIAILQRQLTSDEATALAYYTSRGISIASLGPPLGLLWGGYRSYQTRATYRFPFKTPSPEKFDCNTFAGVIRGQQAQYMWHSARFSAYAVLGSFVSRAFLSLCGAVVAGVGEKRDPRLQDLFKALNIRMGQGLGEAKERRGRQPTGHVGDLPGQGQTAMPELWKEDRDGTEDDASPIGGYNDREDGESLAQSRVGILSDQQMRTQEQRQQASPVNSRTENRASTFEMDKVAPQPTTFDDFDDASPSAGQRQMDAASGSGSTWERIREQASSQGVARASKRMSSTQQEQMEGSTSGDSFAFSETDSDRQLAKHEAQREFDDRVERERRGGDFGIGRGR